MEITRKIRAARGLSNFAMEMLSRAPPATVAAMLRNRVALFSTPVLNTKNGFLKICLDVDAWLIDGAAGRYYVEFDMDARRYIVWFEKDADATLFMITFDGSTAQVVDF